MLAYATMEYTTKAPIAGARRGMLFSKSGLVEAEDQLFSMSDD